MVSSQLFHRFWVLIVGGILISTSLLTRAETIISSVATYYHSACGTFRANNCDNTGIIDTFSFELTPFVDMLSASSTTLIELTFPTMYLLGSIEQCHFSIPELNIDFPMEFFDTQPTTTFDTNFLNTAFKKNRYKLLQGSLEEDLVVPASSQQIITCRNIATGSIATPSTATLDFGLGFAVITSNGVTDSHVVVLSQATKQLMPSYQTATFSSVLSSQMIQPNLFYVSSGHFLHSSYSDRISLSTIEWSLPHMCWKTNGILRGTGWTGYNNPDVVINPKGDIPCILSDSTITVRFSGLEKRIVDSYTISTYAFYVNSKLISINDYKLTHTQTMSSVRGVLLDLTVRIVLSRDILLNDTFPVFKLDLTNYKRVEYINHSPPPLVATGLTFEPPQSLIRRMFPSGRIVSSFQLQIGRAEAALWNPDPFTSTTPILSIVQLPFPPTARAYTYSTYRLIFNSPKAFLNSLLSILVELPANISAFGNDSSFDVNNVACSLYIGSSSARLGLDTNAAPIKYSLAVSPLLQNIASKVDFPRRLSNSGNLMTLTHPSITLPPYIDHLLECTNVFLAPAPGYIASSSTNPYGPAFFSRNSMTVAPHIFSTLVNYENALPAMTAAASLNTRHPAISIPQDVISESSTTLCGIYCFMTPTSKNPRFRGRFIIGPLGKYLSTHPWTENTALKLHIPSSSSRKMGGLGFPSCVVTGSILPWNVAGLLSPSLRKSFGSETSLVNEFPIRIMAKAYPVYQTNSLTIFPDAPLPDDTRLSAIMIECENAGYGNYIERTLDDLHYYKIELIDNTDNSVIESELRLRYAVSALKDPLISHDLSANRAISDNFHHNVEAPFSIDNISTNQPRHLLFYHTKNIFIRSKTFVEGPYYDLEVVIPDFVEYLYQSLGIAKGNRSTREFFLGINSVTFKITPQGLLVSPVLSSGTGAVLLSNMVYSATFGGNPFNFGSKNSPKFDNASLIREFVHNESAEALSYSSISSLKTIASYEIIIDFSIWRQNTNDFLSLDLDHPLPASFVLQKIYLANPIIAPDATKEIRSMVKKGYGFRASIDTSITSDWTLASKHVRYSVNSCNINITNTSILKLVEKYIVQDGSNRHLQPLSHRNPGYLWCVPLDQSTPSFPILDIDSFPEPFSFSDHFPSTNEIYSRPHSSWDETYGSLFPPILQVIPQKLSVGVKIHIMPPLYTVTNLSYIREFMTISFETPKELDVMSEKISCTWAIEPSFQFPDGTNIGSNPEQYTPIVVPATFSTFHPDDKRRSHPLILTKVPLDRRDVSHIFFPNHFQVTVDKIDSTPTKEAISLLRQPPPLIIECSGLKFTTDINMLMPDYLSVQMTSGSQMMAFSRLARFHGYNIPSHSAKLGHAITAETLTFRFEDEDEDTFSRVIFKFSKTKHVIMNLDNFEFEAPANLFVPNHFPSPQDQVFTNLSSCVVQELQIPEHESNLQFYSFDSSFVLRNNSMKMSLAWKIDVNSTPSSYIPIGSSISIACDNATRPSRLPSVLFFQRKTHSNPIIVRHLRMLSGSKTRVVSSGSFALPQLDTQVQFGSTIKSMSPVSSDTILSPNYQFFNATIAPFKLTSPIVEGNIFVATLPPAWIVNDIPVENIKCFFKFVVFGLNSEMLPSSFEALNRFKQFYAPSSPKFRIHRIGTGVNRTSIIAMEIGSIKTDNLSAVYDIDSVLDGVSLSHPDIRADGLSMSCMSAIPTGDTTNSINATKSALLPLIIPRYSSSLATFNGKFSLYKSWLEFDKAVSIFKEKGNVQFSPDVLDLTLFHTASVETPKLELKPVVGWAPRNVIIHDVRFIRDFALTPSELMTVLSLWTDGSPDALDPLIALSTSLISQHMEEYLHWNENNIIHPTATTSQYLAERNYHPFTSSSKQALRTVRITLSFDATSFADHSQQFVRDHIQEKLEKLNQMMADKIQSSLISGLSPGSKVMSPTCFDKVYSYDETDMDCGGESCFQCTLGRRCLWNSDCISLSCNKSTYTCQSSEFHQSDEPEYKLWNENGKPFKIFDKSPYINPYDTIWSRAVSTWSHLA